MLRHVAAAAACSYQAAGEFEQPLDWKPLLADSAAQTTSNRLIATLEAFLRQGPTTGRVVEFDHLLMWVLDAARRGERADRIAVEIQLRLTRLIPSVAVEAATELSLPDPARGARFFGFDFTCERALSYVRPPSPENCGATAVNRQQQRRRRRAPHDRSISNPVRTRTLR